MGWWSTTIMGGDQPMDDLYDLNNLVMRATGTPQAHPDLDSGENYLHETSPEKFRDLLQKVSVQSLQDFINEGGNRDEMRIRAQVVAYLHMKVGATLPQSLRDIAITACQSEDLSVWKNKAARVANLSDFAEMVTAYDDSTPQVPEMQSLFGACASREMAM